MRPIFWVLQNAFICPEVSVKHSYICLWSTATSLLHFIGISYINLRWLNSTTALITLLIFSALFNMNICLSSSSFLPFISFSPISLLCCPTIVIFLFHSVIYLYIYIYILFFGHLGLSLTLLLLVMVHPLNPPVLSNMIGLIPIPN